MSLRPSCLLRARQRFSLPVADRSSMRPPSCSGFSHRCQLSGTSRFAPTEPVSFCVVFRVRAYPDVANCIRANVAKAGHNVMVLARAALLPFAAGIPNAPPLIEGEQERDPALPGIPDMRIVSHQLWVLALSIAVLAGYLLSLLGVCPIPRPLIRAHFLSVRRMPRAHTRQLSLSAIISISHWLCFSRTVVRGGASAETPTPSRLYHALPQGAH